MMKIFPRRKVFFVILEGNEYIKPHAITIYEDDPCLEIYDIIIDELSRQSGDYLLGMYANKPDLMILKPFIYKIRRNDVSFEMFQNGTTYTIDPVDRNRG